MPRRIDIELTSALADGSWTWRAAGAKVPKGTLDAFVDHGTVARRVDADVAAAQAVWAALPGVGIDMEDVAAQLEREGVASFAKAFDELIAALDEKANALKS